MAPDPHDPLVEAAEPAVRSLVARRAEEHRLVQRATLVLLHVYEGVSVSETARRVGASRPTARRWIQRFLANPGTAALADAIRTGRPPVYSCRERAIVIEQACQKPKDLGRLEARMMQWIVRELAGARGVCVSRSTIQRILARAEVRPHQERYYLFTNKDTPEFVERRDAICAVYTSLLPSDELLLCMDEKTNIQALGPIVRIAHGGERPVGPRRSRYVDHSYRRHGTCTLVAAIDPRTGKLAYGRTFRAGEFNTGETIEFLRHVLAENPTMKKIHLVWDNGTTHRSDAMKAFLRTAEAKRLNILPTPVHASWLNLCENFFSRFSRRYLNGRRYRSLEELEQHVAAALIDYQRHARPMAWEYDPGRKAA